MKRSLSACRNPQISARGTTALWHAPRAPLPVFPVDSQQRGIAATRRAVCPIPIVARKHDRQDLPDRRLSAENEGTIKIRRLLSPRFRTISKNYSSL